MRRLLALLALVPALAFGQAQLRSNNVAFTGGQIQGTKLVGNVITGGTIAGSYITGTIGKNITLPSVDGTLAILGANTFTAAQTITTAAGSPNSGTSGYSLFLNAGTPSTSAALMRFKGAVSSDIYFGREVNQDVFVWGQVGVAGTMKFNPATSTLTVGSTTFAGNLSAVSLGIGGGALAAGACASGTVAVSGATSAMAVVTTPNTDPGAGAWWYGFVSAPDVVTFKVCVAIAMTPALSTYNVRVLQ